jgi:hypothetical protein
MAMSSDRWVEEDEDWWEYREIHHLEVSGRCDDYVAVQYDRKIITSLLGKDPDFGSVEEAKLFVEKNLAHRFAEEICEGEL